MKIKVVVLVYNRVNNIKHWINCWKKCHTNSAELIVIQNVDTPNQYPELRNLVNTVGKYIERPNIGFDIGAFQDVCLNRLKGFPTWEKLIWITDDTVPMTFDFIAKFDRELKNDVGVVCMQLSHAVQIHIRTTGFMIARRTAKRLIFSANPVTTKEDCYQFEHRHPRNTFYQQIKRMQLKIVQIAPNAHSPLYDTGYHRSLKARLKEHIDLFGEMNKPEEKEIVAVTLSQNRYKRNQVTFICPIYNSFPAIISSLLMQTNPNWNLLLIHDGKPNNPITIPNDVRIKYVETENRVGNWGHQIRSEYLQRVDTEFVVITNPDNYHMPVYVDYLMKALVDGVVGSYCSDMIHSYKNWENIPCRLERGYIDCAGMMLNTELAQRVGWKNITEHSADWWFFNDLITHYGAHRFVKVKGTLLVHN